MATIAAFTFICKNTTHYIYFLGMNNLELYSPVNIVSAISGILVNYFNTENWTIQPNGFHSVF